MVYGTRFSVEGSEYRLRVYGIGFSFEDSEYRV